LTDQRNKLSKLEEDTKNYNSEGKEKYCKELEILKTKLFEVQTGIENKDETIMEIQKKILENEDLTSKLSIKQLENSTKIEKMKDTKNHNLEGKEKYCKELEILRTKLFDVQTGIENKDETIMKIQKKILENENLTSKHQFSIKQLENSTKIEEMRDQIKSNERSIEELKVKSKESINKIGVANQTQLNLVKTDVEKNKDFSENLKSYLTSMETKFEEIEKCMKIQNEEVKEGLLELENKTAKMSFTTANNTENSNFCGFTKAIDKIQVNSKSLETMVKNMKSEFATQKEIENLRNELLRKNGEKSLDPNHPDIGPIMDSLIMTNDRPYVDCTTLTPMTGNGLIKFERFTALNKLPWDEVNDQFIIQEPGVYAVSISGVLQDAVLSVKIANNVLEREVCSIGSRNGIIGVQNPVFVFRSGLFQIDDDDNVCETVFIEIQAENEDSFLDKNFSLTLFKIAETNGSD